MISVSKEYEIKTKMEATGAMTTAKNDGFFILGKIDFWLGGNKNLVGRRGMNKFLVGGGDSPHSPSWENPVYILYIYILYI